MMRLFYLTVLFFSYSLGAQSPFKGRVRVDSSRVHVRWVPSDPAEWRGKVKGGIMLQSMPWVGDELPGEGDFSKGAGEMLLVPLSQKDSSWAALFRKDERVKMVYAFMANGTGKAGNEFSGAAGFCFLLADQDTVLAKAMACYFAMNTKGVKGKIAFRIRYASERTGRSLVLLCDPAKPDFLPAPEGFTLKQEGKRIVLCWKAGEPFPFASYSLERSRDGKTFEPAHEHPLVFLRSTAEKGQDRMYFADTGVVSGHTYYYRLCGRDPFCMAGPWSETLSIPYFRPLSSYPVIVSDTVLNAGTIRLDWVMHPGGDSLAGLSAWKRNAGEMKWKLLAGNKPDQNMVVDSAFHSAAYYCIHAYGKAGDSACSFEHYVSCPDTIPPLAPEKLTGHIDSLGRVYLQWETPPEPALLGYRIYRRNAWHEEFTEISRHIVKTNHFTDTLPLDNLSSRVQYCVSAMDISFNNSPFSRTLVLMKPDTIPPPAPYIKQFSAGQGTVSISAGNIFSPGLVCSELIRREQEKVIVLRRWGGYDTSLSCCDSALSEGVEYWYCFCAVDSSGNRSCTESIYHKVSRSFRGKPIIVASVADRGEKKITLEWKKNEKTWRTVIYRGTEGREPEYLITLEGDQNKYYDRQLRINNRYVYRLQLIWPDGAMSELSDPVKVEY